MSKARCEYKTDMQKARYDYDRKKTERLENASFKNAILDFVVWPMLFSLIFADV